MTRVLSVFTVGFSFQCQDLAFEVIFYRDVEKKGWKVYSPKMEFWFDGYAVPSYKDALYYAKIFVRQYDGLANDVIKGISGNDS